MSDKTVLAVPGRKLSVPRVFKRTLQISMAALLTSAAALTFIVANSMLLGRGGPLQAISAWLAFIKRPDIRRQSFSRLSSPCFSSTGSVTASGGKPLCE
jgi:hypothetical protein